MKPIWLDLFTGQGGWAHAAHAAGFEVVGIDIAEPPPNYPGIYVRRDIRDIVPNVHIGEASPAVVSASPPCVRFSLAGARWKREIRPLDYELVAHALRIIDQTRPRFWVIENVRGAVAEFQKLGLGEPAYKDLPFYLWGNFPGFIRENGRPLNKWNAGRYGGKNAIDAAVIPDALARPLAIAAAEALRDAP